MSVGGVVAQIFGQRDPEEVVREFGPQVYKHLRRIFGPRADIDDVYQAVFVEVLRSLPSFRGLSKMSTWIRRITWNVAYQEMRLHYRHQHVGPLNESVIADPVDVEEVVEQRVAMGRLYACIEKLEPRQRSAVIMHDIEGKTLRQISGELGRPLPTVASQLYAGRTRLTELMTMQGHGATRAGGAASDGSRTRQRSQL